MARGSCGASDGSRRGLNGVRIQFVVASPPSIRYFFLFRIGSSPFASHTRTHMFNLAHHVFRLTFRLEQASVERKPESEGLTPPNSFAPCTPTTQLR